VPTCMFCAHWIVFKGIVQPKIEILSLFTHPHVSPNIYAVFGFFVEYRGFPHNQSIKQSVELLKKHHKVVHIPYLLFSKFSKAMLWSRVTTMIYFCDKH